VRCASEKRPHRGRSALHALRHRAGVLSANRGLSWKSSRPSHCANSASPPRAASGVSRNALQKRTRKGCLQRERTGAREQKL